MRVFSRFFTGLDYWRALAIQDALDNPHWLYSRFHLDMLAEWAINLGLHDAAGKLAEQMPTADDCIGTEPPRKDQAACDMNREHAWRPYTDIANDNAA